MAGVQSTFFGSGGSVSLRSLAAGVLALSEQREAEKPIGAWRTMAGK